MTTAACLTASLVAAFDLLLTVARSLCVFFSDPRSPPPFARADIVKGLARHEHSALYLKFHALVVEKCGIACVVRTIVDRKTA